MINDTLSGYRLILASQSPRRRQLMEELGIEFEVVIKDYDETIPEGLRGEEIAFYLASHKADSFRGKISELEIVITADTIVWCDGEVLGKPVDSEDAVRILKAISGKTHEVITAVSICCASSQKTFSDTTRVTFDSLSENEIEYYVESFKPYDKAGAYGIQEWIGLIGCSSIEGSYFNVVGLPVQKLYRELEQFLAGLSKK